MTTTFANLSPFQCRSVIGEPKGVETEYCGVLVVGIKRYCTEHCLVYYTKQPDVKKANFNGRKHSVLTDKGF